MYWIALKKSTNGKYIHEEIFNNLSHKCNENGNITEIPFQLSQNGYHQDNNKCHNAVSVTIISAATMLINMEFAQKPKIRTAIWSCYAILK
jgi:hypothetical protein